MASLVPARVLGLTQTGFLAPGAVADVLVVDANLHPVHVFYKGCVLVSDEQEVSERDPA